MEEKREREEQSGGIGRVRGEERGRVLRCAYIYRIVSSSADVVPPASILCLGLFHLLFLFETVRSQAESSSSRVLLLLRLPHPLVFYIPPLYHRVYNTKPKENKKKSKLMVSLYST